MRKGRRFLKLKIKNYMLEFLFLAFFSNNSQDFLGQVVENQKDLPQIEILSPSKVPVKPVKKVAPKFLEEDRIVVLAFDDGSGKILFEKDVARARPIASLTKILSFLVIVEDHELAEVVTVPFEATQVVGAKADIYQYERLTVETLLEAILIPSANDAMLALAIYDSGSEETFVQKMNKKARELGLDSARFFNATGLDIVNENSGEVYGNKMSALDLLKLTRIALENEFFRNTVAKDYFWGTSVEGRFSHEKESTNKLFGTFVNSKGVKTGYTELAGECLINLSEDGEGNEIITIVLGSEDRFGETKNLVSWVLDSFVWR